MKPKFYANLLLAACLCGLPFACNKKDLFPFFAASKNFIGCDVSGFSGQSLTPGTDPAHVFSKEYDPQTGLIKRIVAPLYSIFPLDSIDLDVTYALGAVYFTKHGSPGDTVLIAGFNQWGRVDILVPGNAPESNLIETRFGYTSNYLTSIKTWAGTSQVSYDNKGNVTQIINPNSKGLENVQYTYDYSVKIKKQMYLDDIRGTVWSTFTLAQAMGWLTELTPVNKRIHTKVLFENNDVWYDEDLTDHQIDGEGRLISYKAGGYTWGLKWYCR